MTTLIGLQIIQRGFNIELNLNAKAQSIQSTESSRAWQRIQSGGPD